MSRLALLYFWLPLMTSCFLGFSTQVLGQACPFNEATFAAGGSFSGTCTLEVGASITLTGAVTWTSGTLTINNGPGASANLLIASGASLTISGGTVGLTDPSDGGRFEVNSGGALNIGTSGTFVTTGTGPSIVFDGGWFESTGIVTLGGSFELQGGDATIGGGTFGINRVGGDGDIRLSGDGTLTITGGVLSIQDDIILQTGATGNIDINAGVTVNVGDDVVINAGTIVLDGNLIVGDDVNFGVGGNDGGDLVGTVAGSGSLQFSGTYTPDGGCPYSVGSIDFCSCATSGCTSILPIQLAEFYAVYLHHEVQLIWVTQTELNNDYFEIERFDSRNDSFDRMGRVAGARTTLKSQTYSFQDPSPQQGKNYYRLRQVDLDGTITFSETIMVQVEGLAGSITVHPNPATEGLVTIEGRLVLPGLPPKLLVKNLLGITLVHEPVPVDTSGYYSLQLDVSSFPPGWYSIIIGRQSSRLFVR